MQIRLYVSLKVQKSHCNFMTLAIWKNHQLCALVKQHVQTLKMEDLEELLSYFFWEQ